MTHPRDSETYQRPIVCIVAVIDTPQGIQVLLQARSKPDDDTPYSRYLELPQGKIRAHESLEGAARRELFEETGLGLVESYGDVERPYNRDYSHSSLTTFRPPICVIDTKQNHIALPVVVGVTGEASLSSEASEHRWFSLEEIELELSSGRIFPLNVPVLEAFLEGAKALSNPGQSVGERLVRWNGRAI